MEEKHVGWKFLLLLATCLTVIQRVLCQCPATTWQEPPSRWCVGPMSKLLEPEMFVEAETNDGLAGLTMLPVPNPSAINHFLRGFIISYTTIAHRKYWLFHKEKGGENGAYVVKVFPGLTVSQMNSAGPLPSIYLQGSPLNLAVRLHPLTYYPVNGMCVNADVLLSDCVVAPQTPTLYSPPSCAAQEHLLYHQCRSNNDVTFDVIEDGVSNVHIAQSVCVFQGTNLVSMHSNLDMTLLIANIDSATDITKLIIGLARNDVGDYKFWMDDTEFDFSAWGQGEPSYDVTTEPFVFLDMDKDALWASAAPSTLSFVCRRDPNFPRRLVGGYYGADIAQLSSGRFITKASHTYQFRNSLDNGRYGQSERFLMSLGPEMYTIDDGYKPLMIYPLYIKGPHMQVIFDKPMMIEGIILHNTPGGTVSNYFIIRYANQNKILNYKVGGQKKVIQIIPGTSYPVLTRIEPPLQANLISVHLVHSAETTTSITWDVIGYPKDDGDRVDICEYGDHGCSQVCLHTLTSFKCACNNGYHLIEDGKTCILNKACLPDYKSIGGECYHIVTADVSYTDAANTCIREGSRLASIHSRREFELLRRELTDSPESDYNFFIGLRGNKLLQERWADSTWLDLTLFYLPVPDELTSVSVVYLDKDLNRAWSYTPEVSITAGYICKQLNNHCTVPLLAGPFPQGHNLTVSSGSKDKVAFSSPTMNVFVHLSSTPYSTVRIEITFDVNVTVTGFAFSSGNQKGVKSFRIYHKFNGSAYLPVLDRLGDEAQVFTLSTPPASLAYYWITPVNVSNLLLEYSKPPLSSERYGLQWEVFGCPLEDGAWASNFCDEDGSYFRRFPGHEHEYQCARSCGDFWVDSTISCDSASLCTSSTCLNNGVCYESKTDTWCKCPDGYVDGTSCETPLIRGLEVVGSTTDIADTEEFVLAILLEVVPGDTTIHVDFADDFSIDIQADMMKTFDEIAVESPFLDLSFLNVSQFAEHKAYMIVYSYIRMGVYNITVGASAQGKVLEDFWVMTMISDNPCPTAIIISNLFSGYQYRITYLASVDIEFLTGVDMQCRLTFVKNIEWTWKMYLLTESTPQPDEKNRVNFPSNIVTDENILTLPAYTLSPGLYHIQATLNLTIAPTMYELSAAASGYVVVIEPVVHVAILGGTARNVYVGRPHTITAIVSSFFYDDRVSGEIVNRFNWSCNVGNELCEFVPIVWPGDYNNSYIPVDGPDFTIPSFTMLINTTYTFTVYLKQIGFGNVQELTYKQNMTIVNADIPDLSIQCLINCGVTVQSIEKFTLMVVCSTCDSPSDLIFTWHLKALDKSFKTQKLVFEEDTLTNSTEDVLVIKPDVLHPEEAYVISVTGMTADGIVGYAEFAFSTTPVLKPGQCSIYPKSGYALKTPFRIVCKNFISETALIYSVYLSLYKEQDIVWSFLSASYTPYLNIEMLPRGIKNQYYNHLLLYVINMAYRAVYFIMKVQVLPLGGVTDKKLKYLIIGTGDDQLNDLDRAVQLEIPQEVTELMTSLVPELNTVAWVAGNTPERITMREKLVRILSRTNSSSDNLIQPMSYLINNLLKTQKLTVSEEMLDDSANLTDTLTQRYTEYFTSSTPLKGEKTAEFLLHGISRLRNIVRTQAVDVIKRVGNKSTANIDRRKQLTGDTIREQKTVLQNLGKHKHPGETVSRFACDDVALMVRRDTPRTLHKEVILDPVLGVGGVSIPWDIQDLTGQDVGMITTELIITEYDPFPWGDVQLGQPVNQSSVSLALTGEDETEIELNDLSTPIDVFIPINKKEGLNKWTGLFHLRVHYDTYTGEVIKNLSRAMGFSVFCKPGFSAFVKIDLGLVNLKLSVLIRTDVPPEEVDEFYQPGATVVNLPKDPDDMDNTLVMPEDDNKIFLNIDDFNNIQNAFQSACTPSGNASEPCPDNPPADTTSNLTFHLAFIPTPGQILLTQNWPGLCYNDECNVSVTEVLVTVTAVSMACVYWDEDQQRWTNEGCVATQLSTPDQIHCWCDRLKKSSVFSASIFVLPNSVHPIKDFGLFLTFFENPLVVSLVICIWLYYFILLIWARHKDKQDDSLTGVTVLADNDPGNSYMYLVGVTTGWWKDAHTTANVYMYMEGENGQSFRHALHDERIKRFCTGACDWFLLKTAHCLGELETVTLWHDNSGTSPSWFLKCVVVHDLTARKTWTFIYNDWLAMDRGLRQITVTLPSFSSREIKKNSTHQFFAKWTHDMRDGHLWFSIFAKPLQSSFTRVQRLSCAMVLLLSAMLTNIMFFGIPTDEPEDRLTVQGLVISVPLIVIGIETALVMFLINFTIVQLFLLLDTRKPKTDLENAQENAILNKTRSLEDNFESIEDTGNSREGSQEEIPDIDIHQTASIEDANNSARNEISEKSCEILNEKDNYAQDLNNSARTCKVTKLKQASTRTSISRNKTLKGRNASDECNQIDNESREINISQLCFVEDKNNSAKNGLEASFSDINYVTDWNNSANSDKESDGESSENDISGNKPKPKGKMKYLASTFSSVKDTVSKVSIRDKMQSLASSISNAKGSISRASLRKGVQSLRSSASNAKDSFSNASFRRSMQSLGSSFSHATESVSRVSQQSGRVLTEKMQAFLSSPPVRRCQEAIASIPQSRFVTGIRGAMDSVRDKVRSTLTQEDSSEAVQGETTNTTQSSCRLPWWFIYINWLILVCTAVTCSYFTMLYGLKFGYIGSQEWAVCFFTSFLTSALVTQPLKVLGLAVLITMILRWHVTDQYDKVKDEKLLEERVKQQKYEDLEKSEVAAPQTISRRALAAVKIRVRLEWATQELIKELILYFSFVLVVIIVAHGHKHVDTCYRATKSVEDMFVHSTYPSNNISFTEISTVDDFWEYLTETFIPNLYSIPQDDNISSSYPHLCADGVTLLVGIARLRQVRKTNKQCTGVIGSIHPAVGPCKSLDFTTDEDILSYSEDWTGGQLVGRIPPNHWTYQTATELKTLPFIGKYASYSGGGYVAEIPDDFTFRDNLLTAIQSFSWIDSRTTAIFFEFSLYNPGKNLFSVVVLSLEFLGTGELLPFHQIFTTKLYHYGTDFESLVAVCEVLFILQTICLCYFEIQRVRNEGLRAYFQDAWSYAEVLTVCLCVVAVAMYFQRMAIVNSSIDEMRIKGRYAFVNFFTAAYWDYVLGYVLAFLVLVVILKVFKLFRFNRKLSLFTKTLKLIGMPLLRYAAMAFVYLMAFIHTGLLVFGVSLQSYSTALSSSLTLFNFAIGVSDYFGLVSVAWLLGPLFFFLFVFTVQIILINMLITLTIDGFTAARHSIVGRENDYEVVDYIARKLALVIGYHKLKKKIKKYN